LEARQIVWPFDVGPPAYALGRTNVDDALSLSALYACVRLLADSVASLPLQVYRDTGNDTKIKLPGNALFSQPAARGTLYDWLYSCMTSLLIHGNAYGLITSRDGFGFATTIEWFKTTAVHVVEEGFNGARYFYQGSEIPLEDMVHIRAFTVAGCVEGLSPVQTFGPLIASGLSALQYGNDWYAAGGFPPGTFKNSLRGVNTSESDEIRSKLSTAIRNRQPLVYGSDWDYHPIAVPPEEAQFIAAMRLNATQIAAIYDVPPERVGGEQSGSLTYATQEQDQIRLALTVQRWTTRLEHAFFPLLPERQYVKFNIDATIRTDLKTRHDVYMVDRKMGLKNIDELRALDDLDPLPDGAGKDYTALEIMVVEANKQSNTGAATTPNAPFNPQDPMMPNGTPKAPQKMRAI
jgi:HK97 family phage portal protein